MTNSTNEKATSLNDVISEKIKDKDFRLLFDKEIELNKISEMVYNLRIGSGMTQVELAKKADITQPVLARLESGRNTRVPTLTLLVKIAKASGKRLSLNFEALD